jgi:hypothetical protein
MFMLRRLAFLSLIACGLSTAAWSGLRGPASAHAAIHLISKPVERQTVVWIDTARN